MEYSVFDAHCDTLCIAADKGRSLRKNDAMIDFRRMSRYKSYTQIFACWIEPKYLPRALERGMKLIDTYYENPCNYKNIRTILSIEGGELISSVEVLRNLYRLGVRIIALTWNYSNHIASGADEKDTERGLTEFGKIIVNEMNRIGMYIDVSHLNDRSFYDIEKITNVPIIATHSNSRSICRHRRNLTDDMFKRIVRSGGCVGINFYPPFLNERNRADIDDIVCHIEHFMSLGGENSIGIGADFDGVDALPEGINGCEDVYKVFDRLLQLNYSEDLVEKISHKNFENLFYGGK